MANHQASLPDDEDLPGLDKDPSRREKAVPASGAPPHAGRTGGAGARAERPNEDRKAPDSGTPGRGGKAPSASDKGQPTGGDGGA